MAGRRTRALCNGVSQRFLALRLTCCWSFRGAQVINASVPHSRSSGSLIDVQRSDPAASPARPIHTPSP